MAQKSLETDQQISIQALIRSWQGKLTWDLLVTKIDVELSISTTRQTLDKYINIKQEYKEKKAVLRGKPVSESNTNLLSYLEKDIDKAEKIIQLENELALAREEIGYLQAFISKISNIAQSSPAVMDIFQKALNEIQANTK
ncbi:hypothetical protein QUN95_000545 [Vibrio parahaemolyticus]|nr:hypothetical protein [Vibrio parahaemolyticus]EHK9072499.1 hypothetical protein [Vibrio parahaemolyticus]EIU6789967.1 hypothetical protein [Vibrio parahaemolyticus]EIZ1174565.1 hypothetical protein [Vibrio parahaemolyticus]EJE8527967.1 hypothetical protein [Vibrio parahaemolyticus]